MDGRWIARVVLLRGRLFGKDPDNHICTWAFSEKTLVDLPTDIA